MPWRIDVGVPPTWTQGVDRLETLAVRDDAPEHFTFRSEFSAPLPVEN